MAEPGPGGERRGPAARTATPSLAALSFPAPAKVNLYLHVTGRRADGYHELDSLIAFAGVGDTVTVWPADDLSLAVDGPFADRLPPAPDNLVLRAARRLARAAGVEAAAAITLTKRLPVASGLGGGSADAAATLRALARLWGLPADDGRMKDLALGLGADVPACLGGACAFVGGIGERLRPAPPLPPAWLVLAYPGVPLATAAVFAGRAAPFSRPAPFDDVPTDAAELAALLAARRNDLTEAAAARAPAVGEALAVLEAEAGSLLARMSGSGATCFALFAGAGEAQTAAQRIATAHPGWWVAAAPLLADAARAEF